MFKQVKSLNKKDLTIVLVVLIGLLVLNIPVLFYIREIGYRNSKGTIKLRLEKTAKEIENNIFAPLKNSIGSLNKNHHFKKLLQQVQINNKMSENTLRKVNLLMENTKGILNANTVYLMDPTGEVIAGTNYGNTAENFVGNNYNFRPYFQKAIAGDNYIYGAVGKTSRERGFYFSSPVRSQNEVLGVIVVKIDLKALDQILDQSKNKIVLLSPENVVFASNRDNYLYQIFDFDEQQKTKSKQFSLNVILVLEKLNQTLIDVYIYPKMAF